MLRVNILRSVALMLVLALVPAYSAQAQDSKDSCDVASLSAKGWANPAGIAGLLATLDESCAASVNETFFGSFESSESGTLPARENGIASEACAWHNHQITVTYAGLGIFRINNQKNWCWINSLYPTVTYSSGAAVWTDILDAAWSVSTTVIYHGWYTVNHVHQTLGQANASHQFFGNKSQTNSMCGKVWGNYSYANNCA